MIRARIAELATRHDLTRFATLTLDPRRLLPGARSDRYLRNCWRKMRVLLERWHGRTLHFISVLEFQQSGIAHLHVLFGMYIPQDWLSRAWQSVGGGEIVDIRYVEIRRVSAYLTTYLASKKIKHTLSLLPTRARIFTTSRGIRLSNRSENSGWWLKRKHITYLHSYSLDPNNERYEALEDDQPPVLMAYEGTVSQEDVTGQNIFKVLKSLVRAREANDGR